MLITIGSYSAKGAFTPKRNINLTHYRCVSHEEGVLLSPLGAGRPLKVYKPHTTPLSSAHSTKEDAYEALLDFYQKERP